jgi:phosphoglycolate phosphatase
MRYGLVIFDFDGTLADTFPFFLRLMNAMAGDLDFRRIEEDELGTLRGFSARQMKDHLGVPGWKLPLMVARMRREMAERADEVALFDGVGALLRRLSGAGVPLAVVTSNTEETVRRVLGPESAALIDYYECGASVFGKRPKLRRVLRRAGVPARDALCVGDEIRDAEAARAVGIPFGGVSWGFTLAGALRAHSPDEFFETVEAIGDRVLGK